MGKKNKPKKNSDPQPSKDDMPKIDERFQAMFTDKNFKLKYVTDKRGRPVQHSSSQDLKDFYSIASESASENEEEDEANNISLEKSKKEQKSPEKISLEPENSIATSDKLSDSEDEEVSEKDEESDTSSETSSELSENEINEDDEFDHKWEEWDANAPAASEITKRLALCNMDWDRIRAEDILAVFNSFKPANGIIHSVKIYPSEFGLQRMEEEKLRGPAELVEKVLDSNDSAKENKEGSKYHREKLRQYQLNRLKYYFAVIECDLPETADSLYEQLNGMEYESSAICMDLRFIPDDITFDQEPKYIATAVSDPSEYRPRLFTNSALQQVKVNLTWDETDPKRRDVIQKAFREPETIEKDIKTYLASSSESENEEEFDYSNGGNKEMKLQDRISKYKALLQSIEDKEKNEKNKFEMEITWEPGLKDETEKKVKEKIEKETLTPFEEKLKKKKEEKKLKKKERKLKKSYDSSDDDESGENINDSEDENKSSKNKLAEQLSLLVAEPERDTEENTEQRLSKKKKKKLEKKKKEMKADKFEMDVEDSRFSAIYTSHLYNIDPSDPHYKESKGMRAVVETKLKKRKKKVDSDEQSLKKKVKRPNLENTSDIEDSFVLI